MHADRAKLRSLFLQRALPDQYGSGRRASAATPGAWQHTSARKEQFLLSFPCSLSLLLHEGILHISSLSFATQLDASRSGRGRGTNNYKSARLSRFCVRSIAGWLFSLYHSTVIFHDRIAQGSCDCNPLLGLKTLVNLVLKIARCSASRPAYLTRTLAPSTCRAIV